MTKLPIKSTIEGGVVCARPVDWLLTQLYKGWTKKHLLSYLLINFSMK